MNWLIGKDPDAGKDWRQEEKGRTEDEMVGWHHQLAGHEFEQAPGVGDGQGSLACYSPWGCTELDTTEPPNWNELIRFCMQQYIVLLPICILLFKWMTSLFLVSATCFPPLPYYVALGFWPSTHVEVHRPVSLFPLCIYHISSSPLMDI